MFSVYTLNDPDTGEIKYVGYTAGSLEKRLHFHLTKPTNYLTEEWICLLKKQDKTPVIRLLFTFKLRSEAIRQERAAIKLCAGPGLLNLEHNESCRTPSCGVYTKVPLTTYKRLQTLAKENNLSFREFLQRELSKL